MKLLIGLAVALLAADNLAQVLGGRAFPLPPFVNENLQFGGSGTTETPPTVPEETTTAERTERPTTVRPVQPKRPVCKADSDCGRVGKVYCDKFYGTCNVCLREKQACRRNTMCCKGMECRYGTCELPKKPGRLGSRCKADRDCPENTCCARHYGVDVCKPSLTAGQQCRPSPGGVWWGFHNHCPCGTGLQCVLGREPYRIRVGWYILTFPFMREVSRCHSFVMHTNTQTTTATTSVRDTDDLTFLQS